jgi:hypothetical protein
MERSGTQESPIFGAKRQKCAPKRMGKQAKPYIRLVQEPGWFSASQRLAYKSCKMRCILPFYVVVVPKLQFMNNSIRVIRGLFSLLANSR